MLPRRFVNSAAFAVIAILMTVGSTHGQGFAPIHTGGWTASYIPVVVNDPAINQSAFNPNPNLRVASIGDPYALTSVRHELPWLGGFVGQAAPTNSNPAPAHVSLGQPSNGMSLAGGPVRGGILGGRARIGNGQLFPNAYNAVNKRLWLRTEWLLWDTKGMDVPSLVSSSTPGTTRDVAAVLGEPNTAILFGGNNMNGGTESGLLFSAGFWITPQQNFAIEGEYFQLGEQNERYRTGSDGTAILGRPFFDIVAGQETAQLFSYPGLVSGSIDVDTETNFRSILINGRASLCPTNPCNHCGLQDRVDWLIGFRHLQLDDTINITENLNSLIPTAPGTIAVHDRFRTENEFNGLQLGVAHRANFTRGWLESMLRVALGSNQQTVRINGTNTITEAGLTDTLSGGLLAQRTNIGTHRQDEFTMIPEVGVRLGMRLTSCLSATVGYQVIYFPNVVRAGDQISTDLNPGLVPPEAIPFSGPLRPDFMFVESDYWAHGLTLGGELAF